MVLSIAMRWVILFNMTSSYLFVRLLVHHVVPELTGQVSVMLQFILIEATLLD